MKSILFFGDSLTWGYDAETGKRFSDEVRFTGRLAHTLSDCRIIEEGLKGRTNSFDDSIEEGRNGCKALPMLLNTHNPIDIFVIMLGTNDSKRKFHCSAGEIASGLKKNIQIVKTPSLWEGEKIPEILIVCPPAVSSDYKKTPMENQFGKWSLKVSGQLSAKYRELAEEFSCEYIDANEAVVVSRTDGVHLDADGHKKLAELLEKKLREMLKTTESSS